VSEQQPTREVQSNVFSMEDDLKDDTNVLTNADVMVIFSNYGKDDYYHEVDSYPKQVALDEVEMAKKRDERKPYNKPLNPYAPPHRKQPTYQPMYQPNRNDRRGTPIEIDIPVPAQRPSTVHQPPIRQPTAHQPTV
jgi:hypothetical protein